MYMLSIFNEQERADPTTHVDNEYSRAGIQDPKIVITTSRDPSSKLLQFSKVCTHSMQGKKDGANGQLLGNAPGIPQFAPNKSRKLRCERTGRRVQSE